MKTKIILSFFIAFISITSVSAISYKEKTKNFTIQPNTIDASYSLTDKEHFIVPSRKTNQNKLVLFIGGSFSTPKNYNLICNHTAKLGFDVISLSYLNGVAAGEVAKIVDEFVFDKYREEICFGTQISDKVVVDSLNSIATRSLKLIQYLVKLQPEKNWNQYLTENNQLNWDKIIVAGHSQGAGHAGYLAKKFKVNRVVMFAGPNDFNVSLNKPANWLSLNGKTETRLQFVILHEKDEVVKTEHQISNLKNLGLYDANFTTNRSKPYVNSNVIIVNVIGLSNHNSVVGNNRKLKKIWTYLFTGN